MAQDVQIQLDRKHRAHRSGDRWAVTRLQPDGSYDLVEAWDGGRRSLIQWAQEHDVHPSREAERILDSLSETTGFRDR